MEDIAPKLYQQIRKLFDHDVERDPTLRKIKNRIRDGTAKQPELLEYSKRIGKHASKACREVLTPDNLPEGTLYYNIGERTVKKLISENEADIIAKSAEQLRAMNKAKGIGLKPKRPKPNGRAESLVSAICDNNITAEAIYNLLGEPLINVHESAVDDFISTNAEVADQAGLDPVVIRNYDGVGIHDGKDACQWCLSRAGRWSYGEALDNGVFERHPGCGCTVEYQYNGTSQDVWSKATWETGKNEARLSAIKEKQDELMESTSNKREKARERDKFIREKMNNGATFKSAWAEYLKRG